MENSAGCTDTKPSFMEELEKTWYGKMELLDSLIMRMEKMAQRFEPKPSPSISDGLNKKTEVTESISARLYNQTINVGGKLDHAHSIMDELDKIV